MSFYRGLTTSIFALLLVGCTHLGREPGPESAAQLCWPSFPYQEGWLGGDAAYSVPLSDSDTLWLFGDTFIGAPNQVDRRGSRLVHNSIAVSRCRSGSWEIDYAWTHGPQGEPRAFLERDATDSWWWLFDGFLYDGRLYLGLLEVERTPPRGELSLPFAFTGVDLARIRNPQDSPADWRIDVVSLTDTPQVQPASAMVVDGDYAYLFAFIDRGDGTFPRGLTRLALASLDGDPTELGSALERLAADGSWKRGKPDATDMKILMDDTATEMSVRAHPEFGWLALYNFPDVATGFPETRPSDAVWIRTADNLEGPWSKRRLLFRIPELADDYVGGHDPNTGCYAAKQHAQFSRDGRLTFTYVCNLFQGPDQNPMLILQRLERNMKLYRPVPVSVELPLP